MISPRLKAIVDALPLCNGMRVLEIGCGPGAMAREIAARIGNGHITAIDRSVTAIKQAESACAKEIAAGRLTLRCVSAEQFELATGEQPFDLAIAVRVGALDGRHPQAGCKALPRLRAVLAPHGRLFVDGGDPLRQIALT